MRPLIGIGIGGTSTSSLDLNHSPQDRSGAAAVSATNLLSISSSTVTAVPITSTRARITTVKAEIDPFAAYSGAELYQGSSNNNWSLLQEDLKSAVAVPYNSSGSSSFLLQQQPQIPLPHLQNPSYSHLLPTQIYGSHYLLPSFEAEVTDGPVLPSNRKRKHTDDEKNLLKYKCRFCSQAFDRSQALGGHMNRHRQEREVESMTRARQLLESDARYSNIMQNDLYGFPRFGGVGSSPLNWLTFSSVKDEELQYPNTLSNVCQARESMNLVGSPYENSSLTFGSQSSYINPNPNTLLGSQRDVGSRVGTRAQFYQYHNNPLMHGGLGLRSVDFGASSDDAEQNNTNLAVDARMPTNPIWNTNPVRDFGLTLSTETTGPHCNHEIDQQVELHSLHNHNQTSCGLPLIQIGSSRLPTEDEGILGSVAAVEHSTSLSFEDDDYTVLDKHDSNMKQQNSDSHPKQNC